MIIATPLLFILLEGSMGFSAQQMLLAILASGSVTSLVTYLLQRRKISAEIRKINSETDENLVNQYRLLLDEYKTQSEKRINRFKEEVDALKNRELELLKQNTLILEHKKNLSERLGEMEKDNKKLSRILDNTSRKLRRYEKALSAHKVPIPHSDKKSQNDD